MSGDLAEFLLARIAEDEAEARRGVGWADRSTRWGRVLAECEAKRRIVAEHGPFTDLDHSGPGSWCRMCVHAAGFGASRQDLGIRFPCPTLRFLALPYADHPDYDPEWRPAYIEA